jgi:hypothetical protein
MALVRDDGTMSRKPTKPITFTQRDAVRAIKAVQATGLSISMLRIEPDGAILVVPGTPRAAPSVTEKVLT